MSGSEGAARSNAAAGATFILLAAMLWGTTGTSQALAPIGSNPQEIGTFRLLVGGGFLLLLSLAGKRSSFTGIPVFPVLLSGLFVALYQLCFFWGVWLTGVAVGTIVGIGSAPIFAGILQTILYKKPPGTRWYVSTGLAVAGCILLGASGSIEIHLFGIVLSCGAGLSYAAYTLLMKQLVVGRSPETIAALVFSCGAILLLPLLIGADIRWVLQPTGLLVVIHLGLFATALSYYLFCRGLKTVPVSTAVTLSLAEPLTASVLGIIVIGERFNNLAVTGMFLILAGLIIIAGTPGPAILRRKREQRD
jgi:DME family drug/metabolite transporter